MRYSNTRTEAGMEKALNMRHPDPDQVTGAGGVRLWDPDHACYDVLEPDPTRPGHLRRLYSYDYRGGRRRKLTG